jgi:uncharacterized protein YraI
VLVIIDEADHMSGRRITRVILVLFALSLLLGIIAAQDFGFNWSGQYFDTRDWTGTVINRVDPTINFNWGTAAPVAGIDPAQFSVRWTGSFNFTGGLYRFTIGSNDGAAVYIDGMLILDNLANVGAFRTISVDANVAAGLHQIRVDYFKDSGEGSIQFFWESLFAGPTLTAGPTMTPSSTGQPAIPEGALRATVINAAVLNVRTAPTTGGGVIDRIRRGETYQVVGRNENATWFLLQTWRGQGWSSGHYLAIDGNEFNAPIASAGNTLGLVPGVPDTGYVVQVLAGMRLRATPDVFAAQTGRIPWGSFLPVTGRTAAGDWYQVVWKGTVGWVFGGYAAPFSGSIDNVPVVTP